MQHVKRFNVLIVEFYLGLNHDEKKTLDKKIVAGTNAYHFIPVLVSDILFTMQVDYNCLAL